MMKIEDISSRDLMVEEIRSEWADGAFGELLDRIGRIRSFKQYECSRYLSAVIQRHRLVPCGLSRGLAFPNAHLGELPGPCLAIGRSKYGIDLGAKDGSLSRVLLLYLGRSSAPPDEKEMLGRLSDALADPLTAGRLSLSESADRLWETLRSIDQQVGSGPGKGGKWLTR